MIRKFNENRILFGLIFTAAVALFTIATNWTAFNVLQV